MTSIGLVLGAGGSAGVAYHAAVVAALEEATGWDPRSARVIVGTSAGSITGALLRGGIPAADLRRLTEGEPLSAEAALLAAAGRPRRPRPAVAELLPGPLPDPLGLALGLLMPWSRPLSSLLAAMLPAGRVPTEPISEGIDAIFGGSWPKRPLWLCAVSLRDGTRVVFGRDAVPAATVGKAVAASCAIPAYFAPVRIGRRLYVDGGVWSLCNLDVLAGHKLDLVVVSAPMSQSAPFLSLDPMVALRAPARFRLRQELSLLRRSGTSVVAIEPGRRVAAAMGLNLMDARRRVAVSKAATETVFDFLAGTGRGQWLATELAAAARQPSQHSA